jgi:CheY-like chemotaxis protein
MSDNSGLPKKGLRKINHILLIDDEQGVVTALRMLLEAVGYQATAFHKSPEAIAFLQSQIAAGTPLEIDLVLSDLRMPEMDGIAVLDAVKRLSPTLPFVLMSGHATVEDQKRAAARGADGFLAKPFSPNALHELVAEIELAIAV